MKIWSMEIGFTEKGSYEGFLDSAHCTSREAAIAYAAKCANQTVAETHTLDGVLISCNTSNEEGVFELGTCIDVTDEVMRELRFRNSVIERTEFTVVVTDEGLTAEEFNRGA
jgi:hypothetical protein